LDKHGGDIRPPAIDVEMPMRHKHSSMRTTFCVAQAKYNVIKPALQHL